MTSQEEGWLLEEKYKGEKSKAFFADLERIQTGEPLGYVIGHVPFLDCQIHLDSHPLIPRPETEYWTELAIAAIPQNATVLDLCAGSGAIGVAIAKAIPDSRVDFAELEVKHIPTIEKNLVANNIEFDSNQIIRSDLFDNVSSKYDFILSNPPYIDPVLDRAESSVKDFEPHEALYGGVGGTELMKKIITEAPTYLHADGQLWLEHEPEQVEMIKRLAGSAGFASATPYHDQYGTLRYSVLKLR